MKAWRVTAKGTPGEVLSLQEAAVPTPGEGEVQIKVSATGVGLPDVLMCRGEYLFSPEIPFTPGQEVVGTITATAQGSAHHVGDRIMAVTAFYNGHGGYAEVCLAPEGALYPVPDGMSDPEAAGFMIPYHTAYVGLVYRGALQAGETVLVLGAAGSSGSAAIQLAKAMGANVIAAAAGSVRQEGCRQMGADHVVDSRDGSMAESVLQATEGRGVDVVFDPVGGTACAAAFECCAVGARILAVGFAAGEWGSVPTEALVLKNCSLVGVYVGACSPEQMQLCHSRLCELYLAGKINASPGATFAFEETPEALESLLSGPVPGKVVVTQ